MPDHAPYLLDDSTRLRSLKCADPEALFIRAERENFYEG
jgi:hypothetical protein